MPLAPKPVFFWAALSIGVALFPAFAQADDIYVLTGNSANSTAIMKVNGSGNVSTFAALPGPASSLVIDSRGNLFVGMEVSSPGVGIILKITNNGTISTFASGLRYIESLAVDPHDNLFVHDVLPDYTGDPSVVSPSDFFKITTAGTVSHFAPGTVAIRIYSPAMAFDTRGDLFAAGFVDWISKFTTSPTTGNATEISFVDNKDYPLSLTEKIGLREALHIATSMAFGPDGNLYVGTVETFDLKSRALGKIFNSKSPTTATAIYKITPTGVVSKLADHKGGHMALAFDSQGQLFAADASSGTIYRVSNTGVFTPFVTGLNNPYQIAIVSTPKLMPNSPWLKTGLAPISRTRVRGKVG